MAAKLVKKTDLDLRRFAKCKIDLKTVYEEVFLSLTQTGSRTGDKASGDLKQQCDLLVYDYLVRNSQYELANRLAETKGLSHPGEIVDLKLEAVCKDILIKPNPKKHRSKQVSIKDVPKPAHVEDTSAGNGTKKTGAVSSLEYTITKSNRDSEILNYRGYEHNLKNGL